MELPLPAAQTQRRKPKRVLPGFNITLGFTLFYLCLIVLVPLSAAFLKTASLTWDQFLAATTTPRTSPARRTASRATSPRRCASAGGTTP